MSRGGAGYARGRNALAICERCGLRVKYLDLMYDGDTPSLKVCADCWDPEHPQDRLPDTFDPVTLYDPTGDPDFNVAGGYVTVSVPWEFAPPEPMSLGLGVGIGSAAYLGALPTDTGDSFAGDAFDTFGFDTDSFDL